MRAILFLDVDGVLNSRATIERRAINKCREPGGHGDSTGGMMGIDPHHVQFLKQLYEQVAYRIVISSTWRLHKHDQVTPALKKCGLTAEVIGKTPHGAYDPIRGLWNASVRGYEIQAWLRENAGSFDSYAVLDDDSDMPGVCHRFVQTDGQLGLGEEHVPLLVEVLNQQMTRAERISLTSKKAKEA